MLLSIIVPVYNMMSGQKLEQCMHSLLSQDMSDYEIIAVDDKSTDASLPYLYQLAEGNQNLHVIASPENRKQGGARNLGISAASGEWIGFVDSDDWVAPDMFPRLLAKASETNADIVGCNYLLTDAVGKTQGDVIQVNSADQTGLLNESLRKLLILDPGSMVVKIYRKTLFTENHIVFPENMFYEDNAITVLPFLYAGRFERVEDALYYYLQDTSSTVHTVSLARCHDRMSAMEYYLAQLKERGFYDTYRSEADYKFFELGYKNTLFSYLQSTDHPDLSFVKKLRSYLLNAVPDYGTNEYISRFCDAETIKLVRMHIASPIFFLAYYRMLKTIRKIRSRK